jgi:hypothetical protein
MTATPVADVAQKTIWPRNPVQAWGQGVAIILLNLLSPGLWLLQALLSPYLHRAFPTLDLSNVAAVDISTLKVQPLPPDILLLQVMPILIFCLFVSFICFRLTVWASTRVLQKVVSVINAESL